MVVSTRLPAVNTNTNTDQYEDTNHDKDTNRLPAVRQLQI